MTPRAPLKHVASFGVGLGVLLASTFATALVYLSFFPADQGTFAPTGTSTVTFTSDSNHAATQAEYAALDINVVGLPDGGALTATRNVYLPCTVGELKVITNTTVGAQAIAVGCGLSDGGPAGTLVSVANGQKNSTVVVSPDGVNYVSAGGGGGSSFDAGSLTGDISCTGANCTVTDVQGMPFATGAPVAGNVWFWNGSQWLPGALNLTSGTGFATGEGASGNVLRSNGSQWTSNAIQSSDLTTALTTAPPIVGTSLALDAGFTLGQGGNAVYRCDSPTPTTLSPLGWTTVYSLPPFTTSNHEDSLDLKTLAVDFTDAGQNGMNHIGCKSPLTVDSNSDGGLYLSTTGIAPQSSVSLPCVAPDVTLGCTSSVGDAGCTKYTSNATTNPVSIAMQAVLDGGQVLVQASFSTDAGADGGTYPTYRAGVEACRLVRTGTAP